MTLPGIWVMFFHFFLQGYMLFVNENFSRVRAELSADSPEQPSFSSIAKDSPVGSGFSAKDGFWVQEKKPFCYVLLVMSICYQMLFERFFFLHLIVKNRT